MEDGTRTWPDLLARLDGPDRPVGFRAWGVAAALVAAPVYGLLERWRAVEANGG